jgi:hypothetical protein
MITNPITVVTQENLDQVLRSHATLFTTVVPWFGEPYEQAVFIYPDDRYRHIYYRFLKGWIWYPVELKKHSPYIYINGQVLYIN